MRCTLAYSAIMNHQLTIEHSRGWTPSMFSSDVLLFRVMIYIIRAALHESMALSGYMSNRNTNIVNNPNSNPHPNLFRLLIYRERAESVTYIIILVQIILMKACPKSTSLNEL